jgi:hypothetical protein
MLFVVIVGVTIQSIVALASLARSADTRDLAESIENGFEPEAAYIFRFVSVNGLDRPSSDCGDAFTRSRLTVGLAALEVANKGEDVTLVDSAEKNALDIVKHRLDCNPLDGNAWLRLAMIEVQASGPAPAAIDALRLSYWSNPNESWVMEARLPFATRLYLAGAAGFESEYLDDLRRFATYEPAKQVAAAYVATAPRIQALLHPLIAGQAEARKMAIAAEIDRLGVVFDDR